MYWHGPTIGEHAVDPKWRDEKNAASALSPSQLFIADFIFHPSSSAVTTRVPRPLKPPRHAYECCSGSEQLMLPRASLWPGILDDGMLVMEPRRCGSVKRWYATCPILFAQMCRFHTCWPIPIEQISALTSHTPQDTISSCLKRHRSAAIYCSGWRCSQCRASYPTMLHVVLIPATPHGASQVDRRASTVSSSDLFGASQSERRKNGLRRQMASSNHGGEGRAGRGADCWDAGFLSSHPNTENMRVRVFLM
jgi:hypothetical protein